MCISVCKCSLSAVKNMTDDVHATVHTKYYKKMKKQKSKELDVSQRT